MTRARSFDRMRSHLLVIAILAVGAFPLHGVVRRAAALVGDAAPDQLFPTTHFGLLYVLVPLASLSAAVLFLAPGLGLAVALGRARTVAEWFVTALALSLVVISVAAGVATKLLGVPVSGMAFAGLVTGLAVLGFLAAADRVQRQRVTWPIVTPTERVLLLVALALALVPYWMMAPKFLWESFNGDGAHAYESSRLLLRQALPFWPENAGPVALFPGVTSMLFAYPNAWYLRLFGEVEAAVRLPLLLYLPLLFMGLMALGTVDREEHAPAPLRQVAVAIGILAYALAMAWSATYNPYNADIALPATQDTLLMVVTVGALSAFATREWGWLGLFALLTYLSLPNGLLLLGFLLVAHVLVARPRPWPDTGRLAAVIVMCVVWPAVAVRLAAEAGAPGPGGEYGLVGVLQYFAFLQFTDASRLLFVLIPAGILPVLTLLAWRRQDTLARTLTLITVAYFLFFFVQAHISLHHFVPAMILPVAVALRTVPAQGQPGIWWNRIWIGFAVVAVVLSLPRAWTIHLEGRRIGQTIVEQIGDYAKSDPEVMSHSSLLEALFPFDWDPAVPDSLYGGSPLVWNHYARRGPVDSTANYVLQQTALPPPAGWTLVTADTTGASLYVRDSALWAAHRMTRPPTQVGSVVYHIPRGILFRSVPLHEGPRIIDVVATLESMGFDMTPLLARLGVQR